MSRLLRNVLGLLRGPIARSTVTTSGVLGVRAAVLALHMLLVARLAGPDAFAEYVGVGVLAVIFGGMCTFGTHLLVLRDTSREGSSQSLALAFGTWRILVVPLVFIYLLACQWMDLLAPSLTLVIGIGVGELFFQPLLQCVSWVRQGRGDVAVGQAWLVAPLLSRTVLISVLFISSPPDPLGWLGLVHAVAAMVSLMLILCYGRVEIPRISRWRSPRVREWVSASSFAVLGITGTGQAEVDKLVSLQLLEKGAAGVYGASSRLQGGIVLPVVAMLLAALPRLFSRDGGDLRLQRWLAYAAMGYGLAGAALIWGIAPWLQWLLGPGYAGVEGCIRVMAFALPAQAVRMVVMNVLMAKGNPMARVGLEVMGIMVLVVVANSMVNEGATTELASAVVMSEWLMLVFASIPLCVRIMGSKRG